MHIRDLIEADRSCYYDMSRAFYSSCAVDHAIAPGHFVKTADLALAASPLVRVLMIEQDGKIAGYGLLSFTYSNEAGGMVVWLEELYILPQFQNLKLGTGFLQWVLDCYKNQVARFRLEVTPTNQGAARLYQKLGFTRLDYQQMVLDLPEKEV